MQRAQYVYVDGEVVAWADATTHLLTHSLHYGLAVFEGIRCYATDTGPQVFRLTEHMDRLINSARILFMRPEQNASQLTRVTLDLIHRNAWEACYIRPLLYFGDEVVGLNNRGAKTHAAIMTWSWGAYLGEEGLRNGIRCQVSSFTRHHPNVAMTKSKCSGNYANSQLARLEAVQNGFDEAIMLDPAGYAVEGSGENMFIVEGERIVTPPLESVLPGITRDTVIQLAGDIGLRVDEGRISRDRLYTADEVFLTGTAAEITPVREVDRRIIGSGTRGPITERIQGLYQRVVKGKEPRYMHWLTPVPAPLAAETP
ncbi:MAG: branched-chain amino acid transaminase [Planctomycetota bacterium]